MKKCLKCGEEKLAYENTYARDIGPVKQGAKGVVFCYQDGCGESIEMQFLHIIKLAKSREIYWVGGIELQQLVKHNKPLPHPKDHSFYPATL